MKKQKDGSIEKWIERTRKFDIALANRIRKKEKLSEEVSKREHF